MAVAILFAALYGAVVVLAGGMVVEQHGSQVQLIAVILIFVVLFGLLFLVVAIFVMPSILVLDRHDAWLGFGAHGRWIPYESVRFVEVFEAKEPYRALRITANGRRYNVILTFSDAQAAVEALHARCRHAAAVDAMGNDFLPQDPRDTVSGQKLLDHFWHHRAAVGLIVGMFLMLVLGTLIVADKEVLVTGWGRVLVLVGLISVSLSRAFAALRHTRGRDVLPPSPRDGEPR
jgi:hypothetical protein